MAPSRERLILGISALIITAVLICFLSSSPPKAVDSSFFINLFAAIVSGFNIAILFSWIAYGPVGGIALTMVSLIAVFLFYIKIELYSYLPLSAQFFIASFIGYNFYKGKNRLNQAKSIRSEKIEEAINVLSNNIKEKRVSINSLEEKLKRYLTLKNVVESLSTVLTIDDINNLIIEKVSTTLGKPGRILLFLVDVDKQELMLSASKNASHVKTKKGDPFDYWVLRHRKSLIVEDITRDFRFPEENVNGAKDILRSIISTPLVSEDKIVGILRMDSPQESAYTQDDLRLLDIISDLGAVAVQNAMLYSKTQELAIKDGLTGLFVRRYFMERFQEEIKRAARNKSELSVLILDIDYFKNYNDKFGHMAGDLVLKHLARTIHSVVKEGDIVARYGGEEIIILLFGRNKEDAVLEAEYIRKTVKDKPFMLRRQETNITVSIGVANYPADATLEEDLISIADESLYRAKKAGRNKVCSK